MKENHNKILVIIEVCHRPNETQEVHEEHIMLRFSNLENMVNIK